MIEIAHTQHERDGRDGERWAPEPGTVTVGELREALAKLPAERKVWVMVQTGDYWATQTRNAVTLGRVTNAEETVLLVGAPYGAYEGDYDSVALRYEEPVAEPTEEDEPES
jgi:6-phosphogluconate dehydrogenase (decarboxylating)